jgi:hypothetical protein
VGSEKPRRYVAPQYLVRASRGADTACRHVEAPARARPSCGAVQRLHDLAAQVALRPRGPDLFKLVRRKTPQYSCNVGHDDSLLTQYIPTRT